MGYVFDSSTTANNVDGVSDTFLHLINKDNKRRSRIRKNKRSSMIGNGSIHHSNVKKLTRRSVLLLRSLGYRVLK